MCLTYPNCQYFLFGIDSRTGLNRCTAQARCNSRRAYGFGGTTAIYARAVADLGTAADDAGGGGSGIAPTATMSSTHQHFGQSHNDANNCLDGDLDQNWQVYRTIAPLGMPVLSAPCGCAQVQWKVLSCGGRRRLYAHRHGRQR